MDNTTYSQRNRDVSLNKAKEYYKNNNERLKKQASDKYRNLSEEDKNKKREYMEKIDIIICLKKISKNLKNSKENIKQKIIDKIVADDKVT